MTVITITTDDLIKAAACPWGIAGFERVFQDGMSWTGESLTIAVQEDLDVRWGFRYLGLPPTDDTRAAAIRESWGYFYAMLIDKAPRDDTRAAAIRERWGYFYALRVDKCPRVDTREAAVQEGFGDFYDQHFGGVK